ncbi:MAG: uroporphyrinogen-III synthase [Gammaproteobacteria bacterium]|nr:uroporphyrinogen-III synthase [Gammaproteobacteria bacterium]
MSSVLSGRRILLTRPEGQVEPLAARLCGQGAKVGHFPAIKIELTPPNLEDLKLIEQATYVVFASINAVRGLMEALSKYPDICLAAEIAAIGPATAEALRQAGHEHVIVARPPYNSEALLSTPHLRDLEHRKVMIVRGQSGREKLAEELRNRGAEVHYLEVYRRDPPGRTLSFKEILDGLPDAICVTSVEIAENLQKCIAPEEKDDLLNCVLIAGNGRIAAACCNLGYTALHGIADNPGDDAMLKALNTRFSSESSIS